MFLEKFPMHRLLFSPNQTYQMCKGKSWKMLTYPMLLGSSAYLPVYIPVIVGFTFAAVT